MLILELTLLFTMIHYLLGKGLTLFSPVMIIVYIYLLSYLGGYLFFDPSLTDAPRFFSMKSTSSDQTILELMALLLAIISGVFVNLKLSNGIHSTKQLELPKINLKKNLMVIPVISIVFYIVGNGANEILYRQVYIVAAFPTIKIIGGVMLIPGAAMLGYYFFSTKGVFKYLSLVLFLVIELLHLSLSTRMFAIAPILFALGGLLTHDSKAARRLLLVFILMTPFLVMMPIKLRGDVEQGLFPLLHKISNWDFDEKGLGPLASLNNLFFFSFPLADYTIRHAPVSLDYVLLNLNPLPGFMTTWASVHSRVNDAIPYSGIAEVVKYSFVLALSIYFMLGFYISRLEVVCRKRHNILLLIATYMFFALFSILTTQYAFRSSMRTIYYLILVHVLMLLISKFKRKPRKASPFRKNVRRMRARGVGLGSGQSESSYLQLADNEYNGLRSEGANKA
ncbi:MAG: hypothetical protein K2P57_05990 [Burkholderiales bacterium]|nr:hypothetical protein [Burkholderiales bacterium]